MSAPKGTNFKLNEQVQLLRALDNDDDFFHITCHLDENLRTKIQKGDFVDLEKLLPKDKGMYKQMAEYEKPEIEIITKSGRTFLTSPQQDCKINGMRRWDQAFRVYAMVYCQANPDRSGEVWQYVDVIHNAAANFSWENVASYDFTFRQLMASKPWRSWAKTCTQG